MNDAVNALQTTEEQSTEVRDFVELGEVSSETKGLAIGGKSDGGLGTYFVG